MAQVTIHLRVALRYSATGWISPSWKAQLARSSEGKLNAARSAGNQDERERQRQPQQALGTGSERHDRERRAEAAIGRRKRRCLTLRVIDCVMKWKTAF